METYQEINDRGELVTTTYKKATLRETFEISNHNGLDRLEWWVCGSLHFVGRVLIDSEDRRWGQNWNRCASATAAREVFEFLKECVISC